MAKFLAFYGPKVSLPRSQEPDTELYPERDESNPRLHIPF